MGVDGFSRFVVGGVNMVVGRQKGLKWLWKSSVTKEVWEMEKMQARTALNVVSEAVRSSEPLIETG